MSSSAEINKALASIRKKKQKCGALFKSYAEMGLMHQFQQELMDFIRKDFDDLLVYSLLCLDKAKYVICEIGKNKNQNTLQEKRIAISKQLALMRQAECKFNSANQAHTDHQSLYHNFRKSQHFQENIFTAIKKKVPSLMIQCNLELSAFETMRLYQERGDLLADTVKKEAEDINVMVEKAVAFVEKLWIHHKAFLQNSPSQTPSKEPRLSQLSSSILSWCSTASPRSSASQPSTSSASHPSTPSASQPPTSSASQPSTSYASHPSTSSSTMDFSPSSSSTIPYSPTYSPSCGPGAWGSPASEATEDLLNSTVESKRNVKRETPDEDRDMFYDSLA